MKKKKGLQTVAREFLISKLIRLSKRVINGGRKLTQEEERRRKRKRKRRSGERGIKLEVEIRTYID